MMHTAEMMRVFAPYRGDAILVPGRSGRYWINLSDNQPLDVELGDPAMGGHAGLGLGLALARPDKRVMLFDSEGDIQMSLGILATVAEQAPPNLYHFVIENEPIGRRRRWQNRTRDEVVVDLRRALGAE